MVRAERGTWANGSGVEVGADSPGTTTVSGHAVPEDAAVLDVDGTALVMSTDAFVVSPLFFLG